MNYRSGKRISQRPPVCLSTWQDQAIVYVIPWVETSGAPNSPYAYNNGFHAAATSLMGAMKATTICEALQWASLAGLQLDRGIKQLERPAARIVPGPVTDGYCPMGDENDAAYFASVRKMFPTIGAKFGPVGHPDSSARPPGIDPIEWHYVDEELPADETTCFIATTFEGSDEVEIASHQGGVWLYDDGRAVTIPVYAWAHAPAKPPKKGDQR